MSFFQEETLIFLWMHPHICKFGNKIKINKLRKKIKFQLILQIIIQIL